MYSLIDEIRHPFDRHSTIPADRHPPNLPGAPVEDEPPTSTFHRDPFLSLELRKHLGGIQLVQSRISIRPIARGERGVQVVEEPVGGGFRS